MRLDRFITLNLAQPLRRVLNPQPATPSLPVLMYHSISRRDESLVPDYFKLCTAPERFRLQMQTLKEHGYTGTDLDTALAQLHRATDGPGKTAALTFDDGFRDFYTEALPVLAEFGFSATIYLPTAFIQEARRAFKGSDCMTWSEVRQAQQAGMQFGAHTVSHPKLYDLAWPQLETEVRDCRQDIEQHLGSPVTSFAYPYAFPEADRTFCRRLRATLLAAGYRTCVTTIAGRVTRSDDPFTLRRLPVNGEDDAALLLAKLTGSYDWMQPAQQSVKRLKRMLGGGARPREPVEPN